MVRILVCERCGWTDKKIRGELKRLESEHPKRVRLKKKDCFDECKKEPVVQVGKKLLAPASRAKIRRAVAKKLRTVSGQ